MPLELKMLVFSSILLFVLIFVQAGASARVHGLQRLAGNRDDLGPQGEYEARAKRCVANHIENLAVFTPLVVAAVIGHVTGARTALATELFFGGRLAHAALYLLGVPMVRPLAFLVSTIGLVLLMLADLGVV